MATTQVHLNESPNPPLLSHINAAELKPYLPALTVISFRGPGQAGGVSKALEPLVRQLETKINWLALSDIPGPAKAEAPSQAAIPRQVIASFNGFSYIKPSVPTNLFERHNQVVNSYLWPLLHGRTDLAQFNREAWQGFRQLNEAVANEALAASTQSFPTIAWIHDYQLALVAPHLSAEAGIIPCQFWHVPWPKPEQFADAIVAEELVSALLSNHLLGFHTTEYATNFLNTVQIVIPEAEVDLLKMQVKYHGRLTNVVAMPLGLDFAYWERLSMANRPKAAAMNKKYRLANQVLLGVDRLDYAKGLLEKLAGLELFLHNNSQWHRRFHFVQIVQNPSTADKALIEYQQQVEAKVKEINERYHLDDWEPIVWLNEHLDHSELSAWYLAADALVTTPVRDGLNLIAKEYVACRTDEQGAVILSKTAGCAAELSPGALLVDADNPYQIAEAFAEALSMAAEEKRRRMIAMRHIIGWNQLHDWALAFLHQAVNLNNKA
ncbi:MAG: trehalose-6-phosphate synthase [Candidatus Obscuribacterales bacterium]|nr:trehalose-6-phosphate synthase [Candidatus Obscuribacterales bacterium]